MSESRAFSSGLQTADATIRTGKGLLVGLIVNTDGGGVNDATAVLYDNTAASGTVLCKLVADAVGAGTANITFPHPIQCENGIHLDITGTGAEAIVYYK